MTPNATDGIDAPLQRVFRAHGVTLGFRSNVAAVLARVTEALPPEATVTDETDAQAWFALVSAPRVAARGEKYQLYVKGTLKDEGFRLSRLLHTLDTAVRAQIGLQSPDRVFVHAGVVVWQGRAIVIPGASGSGKTTLVSALVRAGATYYSDEYALLDAEGKVYPYARPLSVRQGEHRRVRIAVEPVAPLQPATVGIVISCSYKAGASWHVREVSAGSGVQFLFANSLAARERPEFALTVETLAARDALVLEGVRGDADEAASALLSRAVRFFANPPLGPNT